MSIKCSMTSRLILFLVYYVLMLEDNYKNVTEMARTVFKLSCKDSLQERAL